MTIRWNLAKLLDQQGITPYRLAQLTGLSAPSCYELVKGDGPANFKRSTLDALCNALDCDPGDLLTRSRR